jgi:hypothetical protein
MMTMWVAILWRLNTDTITGVEVVVEPYLSESIAYDALNCAKMEGWYGRVEELIK